MNSAVMSFILLVASVTVYTSDGRNLVLRCRCAQVRNGGLSPSTIAKITKVQQLAPLYCPRKELCSILGFEQNSNTLLAVTHFLQ
uniref:Chemokine interleukin-8-like domain-containing protein n=1 Tax=Myripristis murdjan TaxID=586833 RepID=A0A667WZ28_9TELE